MSHISNPLLKKNLSFSLGDWNEKSSVRTKRSDFIRPNQKEMTLENRYWFPPGFMPYLQHPLIINTEENLKKRLTANQLVYFLDYTTILEHKIVNKAIETIIHSELKIEIPESMKIAALQLYTDEGYHALFSHEMSEQVANFYKIEHRKSTPLRIIKILELAKSSKPKNRELTWFLIGFVSETVIAKELLNITCKNLVPSVYQMLRQHLQDEARHSQYFINVFHYVWRNLSTDQQDFATETLEKLIFIFSEIDSPWLMYSLCCVNFSEIQASEIIKSLTTPSERARRAKNGAAPTLIAMKKAGLFKKHENKIHFKQIGLLDD